MDDAPKRPGVYRFDAADAELSLLPMAARRALDCAGVHLSLKEWQTLALADRVTLTQLGAAEVVDTLHLRQLLAERGASTRPEPPLTEADVSAGPSPELARALPSIAPQARPLTLERWRQLSALDRYVLTQLARRGKLERLAEAYAEICAEY